MEITFRKSEINNISQLHAVSGRAYWNLTRKMQDGAGYPRQTDREEFLLQKGAYAGDVYAMTELARSIFAKNDFRLPEALSWWYKAARLGDSGALADLNYYPIEDRILTYSTSAADHYADMEIRCALISAWILTDLGRVSWEALSYSEKMGRALSLTEKCAAILEIEVPMVLFEENPGVDVPGIGYPVQGLTYFLENRIVLRTEILADYERFIQVLFHEIGHLVVYSMYSGSSEAQRRQRLRYGVSDERVTAWRDNRMGIEISAQEEGADTLSYGVWTNMIIYFGQ